MLSDRTGRRRVFVGGAAVLQALACAVLVVTPSWPSALVAGVLLGAGYTGVGAETAADALSSRRLQLWRWSRRGHHSRLTKVQDPFERPGPRDRSPLGSVEGGPAPAGEQLRDHPVADALPQGVAALFVVP